MYNYFFEYVNFKLHTNIDQQYLINVRHWMVVDVIE